MSDLDEITNISVNQGEEDAVNLGAVNLGAVKLDDIKADVVDITDDFDVEDTEDEVEEDIDEDLEEGEEAEDDIDAKVSKVDDETKVGDDDDDFDDDDFDNDDDDEDEDGELGGDTEIIDEDGKSKPKAPKKSKKSAAASLIDHDEILGTSFKGPEIVETNAEDFDSDDDDYEAEDYQKLDDEMRKNYISMNHPEASLQNYDEIYKLSQVVRSVNNIIVDAAHQTMAILTKYEKARVLGVRAKQINNGSVPFIELTENIIDGYLIAERELAEKKIPFIIRRPLPNRASEYWRLEDLEII